MDDSGRGSSLTQKTHPRRYWPGLLLVALLLTVVSASYFAYRFIQNDSGICLAEGRVLGDQEHRQRFLDSLVRNEIENSYRYKRHDGNTELKAGIIYGAMDYDPVRTILTAKNNGKSFEDNFGITVVAPAMQDELVIDYPKEPFVLVAYFDGQDGSATFTPSQYTLPVSDPGVWRKKISWHQRFYGFGKIFYKINYIFVRVECCGNDRYRQPEEVYVRKKEQAYQGTLSSIARGLATHNSIAAASNCGDVLTEESDNGIKVREILWMNSVGRF
ncbi:hypothetical protein [Pseudomonas syringae]|uniref:hypothetical protein n=1 Tax=Pseudomonas syringae TaxID=317 RepID=UPI00073EE994|nr:hypothetical protein [Pseudomonas syringae]